MATRAESIHEKVVTHGGGKIDRRRGRRLGMLDVGVLIAALLVFVLFLFLLIRIVFPQGSRLEDLAGDRSGAMTSADTRGQVGVLSRGGDAIGNFIAHLGEVQRDVKIRSADSIAWRTASIGTTVGNRAAVQTFSKSRARVDFTTDNELRIGQNSLIVFGTGAADPFLQQREPAVVMLSGELQGSVNAEYGALVVQLPTGTAAMSAAGESADPLDFRVGINPDKSSTVAIYSGQADVTVSGARYFVRAKQALTISADGGSVRISDLPPMPLIQAPARDSVARFRDAPPRIDFSWGRVAEADRYRLEISSDSRFEGVLVDELLQGTSFTHGNLPAGEYYWRVSARAGWTLGPASAPRRVRVVRDAEPPALEVIAIDPLADGLYVVRGRAAQRASVHVLGSPVETLADGSFEHVFQPRPGTQTVVVEAADAVGNVAYSSQILHVPGGRGRSN